LKKVIIIGSGLGGLATALRLSNRGYDVKIIEKYSTPGGRLNTMEKEGFKFDLGPSFMSMSYEFDELFSDGGVKNPLLLKPLEPIYQVFFENRQEPYKIYKNLAELQKEFESVEPELMQKIQKYLGRAREFYNDTNDKVIKTNFNNKLEYLLKLTGVPFKHIPYLFKSMWKELDKNFQSDEVKIIFSLVAFFLGSTPFQTPSIYSILNYTELENDGYWAVEGGMYKITEEIVNILKSRNVEFVFDSEIVQLNYEGEDVTGAIDSRGNVHQADIFISNSDAASFRGKILGREKFSESRLDKLHWTLSPFTIYLGVKGKINNLIHHNYFLGSNFKEYADTIFTSSVSPQKPYYYVNMSSATDKTCAPEGCENLFILCPVPDLRYKTDWRDKDELAAQIINDLSSRIGVDLEANTLTKTVLTPIDWQQKFNLYKGSGLGLAHDLNQVGAFRPQNFDEKFKNLFYVGASTTPGTGLPMVVIGSKLVTERIENEFTRL